MKQIEDAFLNQIMPVISNQIMQVISSAFLYSPNYLMKMLMRLLARFHQQFHDVVWQLKMLNQITQVISSALSWSCLVNKKNADEITCTIPPAFSWRSLATENANGIMRVISSVFLVAKLLHWGSLATKNAIQWRNKLEMHSFARWKKCNNNFRLYQGREAKVTGDKETIVDIWNRCYANKLYWEQVY